MTFHYNNGLNKEIIPKTEIIEPNHKALLSIDSRDRITKDNGDYYNSTFLNENFNKLALSRYHFDYFVPQLMVGVNQNFDVDTFTDDILTNSGTVEMIPTPVAGEYQYFETITEMMAHLQNQINAGNNVPGDFVVTPVGNFWMIARDAPNKSFQFKNVFRLAHFGLYNMAAPAVSILVNPRLFYTRYLDIYIDALKDGQKNKDYFSRRKTTNGFFYRLFVELEGSNNSVIQNLVYNTIRPRKLEEITILVLDEYDTPCPIGSNEFSYINYYLEFILA